VNAKQIADTLCALNHVEILNGVPSSFQTAIVSAMAGEMQQDVSSPRHPR